MGGPEPRYRFIDAHCHLADPRFHGRHDELIRLCGERGIGAFVQGGVDPDDWGRQVALARRYPGRIHPCFGVHPWFVSRAHEEGNRSAVEEALRILPDYLGQGVGLGELGLDFSQRTSPESRGLQEEVFIRQLELARARPLPLVLHVVQAHGPAVAILRAYSPYPRGGLIHSFGAGRQIAGEYLALGFTISVGAAVARERGSETLRRAVARLPPDRVVLESDSPDQSPHGFEPAWPGLNDPRSLWIVARALGELQAREGGPAPRPEELLLRSRRNLVGIFGLES